MAFGGPGVPVYGSSTAAQEATASQLAHTLGQVSLESSPGLSPKTPKFTRKYSLRELEIQQTIGELLASTHTTSLCGRYISVGLQRTVRVWLSPHETTVRV